MKAHVHKIASVTYRLELGHEVEISRMVEAKTGNVLVVKALEEKRVYDVLELETGRMAHISKGDVIAGALGQRGALRGFVGKVPEQIEAGDTIHVLNLGGVLGECISENRDVGHSLRVEVLGMVTKDGEGVNIADASIPDNGADTRVQTVIVVSGTSPKTARVLRRRSPTGTETTSTADPSSSSSRVQ